MGFSKQDYEPAVAVEVRHNWHPGAAFVFHFPKVLPQSALDAEASFLALKPEEDKDAVRRGLINLVAEMVTHEPEGFDDFPGAAEVAALSRAQTQLLGPVKERDRRTLEEVVRDTQANLDEVRRSPLAERFRVYFDDSERPELEQIVSGAWAAYKQGARPTALLKRIQNSRAGSGRPSGVSGETPPVV
ncbi:MAG: hypothetical protein ABW208_10160 [Pyrinomonadaceae bacterium]